MKNIQWREMQNKFGRKAALVEKPRDGSGEKNEGKRNTGEGRKYLLSLHYVEEKPRHF